MASMCLRGLLTTSEYGPDQTADVEACAALEGYTRPDHHWPPTTAVTLQQNVLHSITRLCHYCAECEPAVVSEDIGAPLVYLDSSGVFWQKPIWLHSDGLCAQAPLWMWRPYVDLDRNMHEWPAFCRVLGVLLLILLEQRKQVQLQGCCTAMVPCTSTVLACLLISPLCSWYCFGGQRIPSGKGWYGCTRGARTRAWRSHITWANSVDCRDLILPLVVKRKGKTSQKSVRKDKDTEMPSSYKAISK